MKKPRKPNQNLLFTIRGFKITARHLIVNDSTMKSKGNTMSSTVLDNIKGSEIPPVWLKKTKEKPDKMFKITIEVKQEAKPKGTAPQGDKKGKWAKVANRLRGEGFLTGRSEEVNKSIKDFRNNFEL